jgi:holo-[acyl-carrier-protein] synthase
MINGIGIDILRTRRFEKLDHKYGFINNVFTKKEVALSSIFFFRDRIYSALFTLKEAILKALGCGLQCGTLWQHIEIDHDLRCRISGPLLSSSAIKKDTRIHASVACTRDFALSIALKETPGGN